jgi:cysteine desulfurase
MMKFPVYLDYNATTPCDPRVVEAMLPFFTEHYGNSASRSHKFGWEAEEGVEYAREQVAKLIGAGPKEIVFTSGATEAINLALKGVMESYASKGNHVITVETEHKAVLDTCKRLEKSGAEITYLPVGGDGLISLEDLEAAIRPTTVIIAIMYANNETGTIQHVREISAVAKKHRVLFFTDATQAVGKIEVNVLEDGIDLMSFSAHKMYGPKGIGALYVRRRDPRVTLAAQIDGGGHERGWRSGTLNVPAIVGFGKACDIAGAEMQTEGVRLGALRDRLEKAVAAGADIVINAHSVNRLPHVTNIAFRDVDGNGLLIGLSKSLAVSSGSACTSASPEPSHVLKALGLDDDLAHSSIRFSLGRPTTDEEVDFAIDHVIKTVKKLKETIAL